MVESNPIFRNTDKLFCNFLVVFYIQQILENLAFVKSLGELSKLHLCRKKYGYTFFTAKKVPQKPGFLDTLELTFKT